MNDHMTMVDHSLTMDSISQTWSDHGQSWSVTMVDHGQMMVDHGLTVNVSQGLPGGHTFVHKRGHCNHRYVEIF